MKTMNQLFVVVVLILSLQIGYSQNSFIKLIQKDISFNAQTLIPQDDNQIILQGTSAMGNMPGFLVLNNDYEITSTAFFDPYNCKLPYSAIMDKAGPGNSLWAWRSDSFPTTGIGNSTTISISQIDNFQFIFTKYLTHNLPFTPIITFAKQFEDSSWLISGSAIFTTNDSLSNTENWWLLRLNSNFTPLWSKLINITDIASGIKYAHVNNSNELIISGLYAKYFDGSGLFSISNVFCAKFNDTNGDPIGSFNQYNINDNEANIYGGTDLLNGGFALIGSETNYWAPYGTEITNGVIYRFSTRGELIKVFKTNSIEYNNISFTDIVKSDNGYFLSGWSQSDTLTIPYEPVILGLKINNLDSPIVNWAKLYSENNTTSNFRTGIGTAVLSDSNENPVFFGFTHYASNALSGPYGYIIKPDVDGNAPCYTENTTNIIFEEIVPENTMSNLIVVQSNFFNNPTDFNFSQDAIYQASQISISTICFSTDIKEKKITKEKYFMYPNPAKDKLTIETNNTSNEGIISIFDLNGQLLIQQKVNSIKTEIDIQKLTSAIYIIKIQSNKSYEILKFNKE